jgi:hypothetical protein
MWENWSNGMLKNASEPCYSLCQSACGPAKERCGIRSAPTGDRPGSCAGREKPQTKCGNSRLPRKRGPRRFSARQGRVKVAEKAALPPDVRKASGFPTQRSPPSSPRLGWKAQPSSRAEGVSQGGGPRKGEAFPHIRRQSRSGMLRFGDFDATLLRPASGLAMDSL